MKQLTCEMCGSTDLMKQDGVFVCQSCGCKYSVEEAKRMMIEGTVDVQGTVKVDNSAFVEKYLANARRAKQKEDWEETEKYYNLVEQNDPNNIEAIFYSSYGKAKASLVDGDIYKRQAAFKVLNNCVSIIDDKYQVDKKEENEKAIKSMALDLLKMFGSSFVFTEWKNGYGVVTRTNKPETYALFVALIDAFHESMLNIEAKDPEIYMYETFIAFVKGCKNYTFEGYNKYKLNELFDKWISQQNAGIEKLKKSKIDAYWNEHKEEKNQLESEKKSLQSQIEKINNTINSLGEVATVKNLEEQIKKLQNEKDSLGLFKGKEKKALQEQIDALNLNLTSARKSKDVAISPYQREITALNKRISEIESELTKDR